MCYGKKTCAKSSDYNVDICKKKIKRRLYNKEFAKNFYDSFILI